MAQENLPEDNQGNVDPREEKRVVTETTTPVEVKQTVIDTTTTEIVETKDS